MCMDGNFGRYGLYVFYTTAKWLFISERYVSPGDGCDLTLGTFKQSLFSPTIRCLLIVTRSHMNPHTQIFSYTIATCIKLSLKIFEIK